MTSRFNLFFIFILLFSCAKTPEQEIISAKKEALYFLTEEECTSAKNILDTVTPDSDDASYHSIYASVYQCYAGLKQLDIIDDLSSLSAPSVSSLWGTLAAFGLAQIETTADSTAYSNTMLAINTLLNSDGGTSPSAANRITVFGEQAAGDMNLQLLLLITVELGKFLKYYGQAGTDGAKGGANGGAGCLAAYNDATAANHADDSSACSNPGTESTSEMATGNVDYVRRLCEGVVLFNNYADVLSNISFSSNSSELGDLSDVGALLTNMVSIANGLEPAAVSAYESIQSQNACETLANTNATQKNYLERYFALLLDKVY